MSRSAVLGGGAAILASRALREKIVRVASHLFEAAPADIDVSQGQIKVVGTDRVMTFRQLARAVYSEMGRLPKVPTRISKTKQYDPHFGTTMSATHVAVVEIDIETCKIKADTLSRRGGLRPHH
jgi:carbon-monoxide dehydrogenase large subunit